MFTIEWLSITGYFNKKFKKQFLKIFLSYLLAVVLIITLQCCRQKQSRSLPSLSETYKNDDTKPFGSFVTYHHLKSLFDDRYIETTTSPFTITWKNIRHYSSNTQYSTYMLITKNLEVNKREASAMVDYISQGNDMFIAADFIDSDLLDTIKCATVRLPEIISEVTGKMNETFVKMYFGDDFDAPPYKYYYYPFLNSFTGYDEAKTRVLGVNEIGKPDYIIMFIGKGRLYLHAAPRAFSNYFLLTADNYEYLDNVLSYLRFEPKHIYWDEYYKKQTLDRRKKTGSANNSEKEKNEFSSFNVIKNNPPLLWAFILAVAALLLYILVNIKRKQRVINTIPSNINTTVNFTETVGRLYLQKKNNKNIAEKMITYFYEHIRNRYFLNIKEVDKDFIAALSGKTGVDIEKTQQLLDSIDYIESSENVSDVELLQLNDLLDNFYKNKT